MQATKRSSFSGTKRASFSQLFDVPAVNKPGQISNVELGSSKYPASSKSTGPVLIGDLRVESAARAGGRLRERCVSGFG